MSGGSEDFCTLYTIGTIVELFMHSSTIATIINYYKNLRYIIHTLSRNRNRETERRDRIRRRHTETKADKDRQADRQTGRQADRQTGRQT